MRVELSRFPTVSDFLEQNPSFFLTFLGDVNLQKITTQKTRGTLEVEESSSPRKALHYYSYQGPSIRILGPKTAPTTECCGACQGPSIRILGPKTAPQQSAAEPA